MCLLRWQPHAPAAPAPVKAGPIPREARLRGPQKKCVPRSIYFAGSGGRLDKLVQWEERPIRWSCPQQTQNDKRTFHHPEDAPPPPEGGGRGEEGHPRSPAQERLQRSRAPGMIAGLRCPAALPGVAECEALGQGAAAQEYERSRRSRDREFSPGAAGTGSHRAQAAPRPAE